MLGNRTRWAVRERAIRRYRVGAMSSSGVREQDDRVPPEVEEYLVDLYAKAGAIGGALGGSVGGGSAGKMGGRRGGARGGARGARRLRTRVEEKSGPVRVGPTEAVSRVVEEYPRTLQLNTEAAMRLAIPVGITGLQRIVVDLHYPPDWREGSPAQLLAFGKEGLFSRRPTAQIADRIWTTLRG
jgi:hypothetical protein